MKPKFVQRECKHHGVTEYVREGRGYYRCKRCRVEAVQKRREKVKRLLVEYKGGKCESCGYRGHPSVFDFHHTDPNEKEFGISAKGYTRALDKSKREVDKCQLLCANCHREVHAGETF